MSSGGPNYLVNKTIAFFVKFAELLTTTLWSKTLLLADLRWALLALGNSPYRSGTFQQHLVSQQNRADKAAFVFGETPWFTVKKMLQKAQLQRGGTFVDLGSGVGRVVLYASWFFGAKSIGYEVLSQRHQQAEQVVQCSGVAGVTLLCQDLASADLERADVVYLVWTCFCQESRARAVASLGLLQPGARIIAATHPIDSELVEHTCSEPAWYSWGRGTVHYYVRNSVPGDNAG